MHNTDSEETNWLDSSFPPSPSVFLFPPTPPPSYITFNNDTTNNSSNIDSSNSSNNTNSNNTDPINTNQLSKRKRAPKEQLLKVNTDIVWNAYVPLNAAIISLFDSNTLLPIACLLHIGQVSRNALVEVDKCTIYKQNQFQLHCILQGPLNDYSTPTPLTTQQQPPYPPPLVGRTTDGAAQQLAGVEALYLYLYAIKHAGGISSDGNVVNEELVPLHQVGPSRTKKDTQPADLLPISNGAGMFDKLQFQASTHLGSGIHFRAVVCLMAKLGDKFYTVCASMSPKLIVLARNPGRYAKPSQRCSPPHTPAPTPMPPSLHNTIDEFMPLQRQAAVSPPQLSPQVLIQQQQLISQQPMQQTQLFNSLQNYNTLETPQLSLPQQYYTPPLQPLGIQPQPYPHTPSPNQNIHTPSPQQYTQAQTPPQHYAQTLSPQQTPLQNPNNAAHQVTGEVNTVDDTCSGSIDPGSGSGSGSGSGRGSGRGSDDGSNEVWTKNKEVAYYYGRVGVNTHTPQEALTVNGNILVTGDYLKPSDRRIKDNFTPVNPDEQLDIITNIKIYDYDVHTGSVSKRERGVIAQEVAKILPQAVHHAGEYKLNGQTIENLLVVNERLLLMENIGATQYLNQIVDEDRAEIDAVNTKIIELEEEEKKNSSFIMSSMKSMASYVLSEDFREGQTDSCIHCGFSLLGLGASWSLFVLGFIFPPSWVLGTLYMTASNPVKKSGGCANCSLLFLFILVSAGILVAPQPFLYAAVVVLVLIGLIFMIIVSIFRRRREKIREKLLKSDLLEKINNTTNAKRSPTTATATTISGAGVNRRPHTTTMV